MSTKLYIKAKNKLEKIDFTKLTINHDYHGESEIKFTTPEYAYTSQNRSIDIRIISDLFENVGGVVRKRETETDEKLYEYTGYDYSSFFRGKFWKSFKGKTTKFIVKWIAKHFKVKTSSLFNAKKKHKKLVFKGETSGMDALHQVCALDNQKLRPYVTYNKRLSLKYVSNQNSGFVIHVGDYIRANETLDLNDLVNHIIIYTKKGKVKKQYKNKNSIVEFGDLAEVLQYPDKPEKGSSAVDDIYDEFKKIKYEKSRVNYITTVDLPLTSVYKHLKVGYYLVFKFDGTSPMNNKKYWIQEMEISVHERRLKLTLYDRKPFLLDNWRYNDPDGKKVNRKQKNYGSSTSTNSSSNIVTSSSIVNKATNCQYCSKGLTSNKVSYENKCPACGKVKKLTFKNNMFVCSVCKTSFCSKCGSEIRVPKRWTLKRASKVKKPSGISDEMYDKALALWVYGVLQIAYFVASFDYVFYGGDKDTVNQTFKTHSGNCVDLAQVVIAMYKCIGLKGTLTNTTAVINGKKYNHANVKIKINGITYIIDPSCDGKTVKPANMKEGKFIGR